MFYIERCDSDAHTGLNSSCIKKERKKNQNTLDQHWKSCQSAFSAELNRSTEETKTCWDQTVNGYDCVSESVGLMTLTYENIKVDL